MTPKVRTYKVLQFLLGSFWEFAFRPLAAVLQVKAAVLVPNARAPLTAGNVSETPREGFSLQLIGHPQPLDPAGRSHSIAACTLSEFLPDTICEHSKMVVLSCYIWG